MLTASAETIADDLGRYGEDATARWVLTCTDEELVRVCSVAEWLIFNGAGTASGGSMMFARALALAAVYVHKGAPRALARSRRRAGVRPEAGPGDVIGGLGRRPDHVLAASVPPDYGVGLDLRTFWSAKTSPA